MNSYQILVHESFTVEKEIYLIIIQPLDLHFKAGRMSFEGIQNAVIVVINVKKLKKFVLISWYSDNSGHSVSDHKRVATCLMENQNTSHKY
jgi:hypothetical protein